MEAKELRIGNLLEYFIEDKIGGNSWVTNVVDHEDISLAIKDEYFNKYYRPIPLTIDILLKCGATKLKGDSIQYRVGNRLLILRNNFYYDYATDVKLEFVHKFQNFIYALTEKELEIKL